MVSAPIRYTSGKNSWKKKVTCRALSPRKLPLDLLENDVKEQPDAYLREIAEHFNCSIPSVWASLKKLNITLKKTTSYKEQDRNKVRRYLEVLSCFPDTPIVYIDETGMDTYLYRQKARAHRGEKVYDKISGRRFERISLVAGQVGTRIIAPLLYHSIMTSELVVKWY